jgi:hypothetical protein
MEEHLWKPGPDSLQRTADSMTNGKQRDSSIIPPHCRFFHHLGREREQLLGLSQPSNSLGNEVRLDLGYIDLT